MRAVVVGAVESSQIAIEAIAAAQGWTVACVVSLPCELAGRHDDFVDLAAVAAAVGARLHRVPNINDAAALDVIAAAQADYAFVIGWSQICGSGFRELMGARVIGYHPAPLPRMRGRAVIPWTILSGEPISGGTLFWIDEGVDTGDILAQRFFHVAPDETAATLYAKHMRELRSMLEEALPALSGDVIPRRPQDERYATWAARRTRLDGAINWSLPAADIARLVRAVTDPYSGAYTFAGANRLTIWQARAAPDTQRHLAAPGQVIALGEGVFTVMCGDGAGLSVTEWTSITGEPPRQHGRLRPTEAGKGGCDA
ncbi:MAG: methionyl-tRNA formyltransferase [Novosphingobium sp.]|nr:MAG: methionyl-tRNA formyltransferase [Novosphingobium sp.]